MRGWVPVIALVATLSMLLGNLVAIRQTSLRRLLAYSAIAHAGYMLLGIVAHTQQSLAALLYYVITYALAPWAPSPLSPWSRTSAAPTSSLTSTASAGKRPCSHYASPSSSCRLRDPFSPASSANLSLRHCAGLHTQAGRPVWPVALAIAMSIVSLFYYLRVLKRVYVAPPSADAPPIQSPALSQFLVILLAAAVLLFGCAPQLLLEWIQAAVQSSGL